MLRTPQLHYDFIMKSPGGAEFHDVVRKMFADFTEAELMSGEIPMGMYELDETSRVSHYVMALYEKFGQNTYVIGPKVQDLFRRTDLARITPEMITPPVPAFYIALADCPWLLWGGERTQMHNLSGVYVSFTKVGQRVPGTTVIETAEKLETDPSAIKMEDSIQIVLWGAANQRSIDRFDDTILWYTINLEEWVAAGEDLEEFFRQHSIMQDLVPDMTAEKLIEKGLDPFSLPFIPNNTEDITTVRETLVNVLRLVLNLCLYMESEDPELEILDKKDEVEKLERELKGKKSPAKRKKLSRRIEKMPKTRYIYVGPLYEELAEQETKTRVNGGGTHASPIEHGVVPHWQRYWVGSGAARHQVWKHKGMYRRGAGKPDRTITKIRE